MDIDPKQVDSILAEQNLGPSAIEAQVETQKQLRSAADEAEIDRLIALSPLDRAREWHSAAERLGVKIADLRAAVRERLKRVEHSNGQRETHTETGISNSSNRSSNTAPVRTAEELYAAAKSIAEAPDVLELV